LRFGGNLLEFSPMNGLIGNPYPGVVATTFFAALAGAFLGVTLFHLKRRDLDAMNRGIMILVSMAACFIFVSLLWSIWTHR
jgi:hypothetical protein